MVARMNAKELEKIVRDGLNARYVEVLDDSGLHAGHEGAEGGAHFRLVAVSDDFEGLGTLERHRKLNALVRDKFGSGLHALSAQLMTVAESEAASRR